MNKSESIKELTSAVNKVMSEVRGIEKNTTVGYGNSSYKGVADQDVKKAIGESMCKHGLSIYCTAVKEKTKIDNWEDDNGKRKQQIFTRVATTYLLCHTSGEFIEISGIGHGADSQDKAAGKATTYALKYALLYTFLVPTGKIDDADAVHSDDMPVKPAKQTAKPELTPSNPKWSIVVKHLSGEGTMTDVLKKFTLTKEMETKLMDEVLASRETPKKQDTALL